MAELEPELVIVDVRLVYRVRSFIVAGGKKGREEGAVTGVSWWSGQVGVAGWASSTTSEGRLM